MDIEFRTVKHVIEKLRKTHENAITLISLVSALVTGCSLLPDGGGATLFDDNSPKWIKLHDSSKTASFYAVLPSDKDKPLKPAGEWNTSRIVVMGNYCEHWLNGKKVLEYELGGEAVKVGVAASKFKK